MLVPNFPKKIVPYPHFCPGTLLDALFDRGTPHFDAGTPHKNIAPLRPRTFFFDAL